jgi:DNA-3-methyladenine glycosylase II
VEVIRRSRRAAAEEAVRHLRRADPILGKVIDRVGPFQVQLEGDRFRALVRSIISQQISGHAARSILAKLAALLHPEVTPEGLVRLTATELRAAGLSSQKAAYLQDLARRVQAGEVSLRRMARLPDEEVIAQLVQVKGIGVWTAQMFLIFSLGRWDVFPHADLGVRTALRNLYALDGLPDAKTSHRIAGAWRPFATVGSWYCWRSLEL